MPIRQLPTDVAGNPRPQVQGKFSDPDSHILKGSEGWFQGYNAQAAVDGDHQVIVDIGVSNTASGSGHRGAEQPETSIAAGEWIASSDQKLARRSTPCARRWWSRCLGRSRDPDGWIGSNCEAWSR